MYIGGGNSRAVDVGMLPANVTIISNLNGLIGGIALWRDERVSSIEVASQPDITGRPLAA